MNKLFIFLIIIVFTSCVTKKKHNALKKEKDELLTLVKEYDLAYLTTKMNYEEIELNCNKCIDENKIDLSPSQQKGLFTVVESKATPRINMEYYLNKNLSYPKDASKNNIEADILVWFTVKSDGSIINARVTSKAIGYGLEEEAIRLVSEMPKWRPATRRNRNINSINKLSIKFKFRETK